MVAAIAHYRPAKGFAAPLQHRRRCRVSVCEPPTNPHTAPAAGGAGGSAIFFSRGPTSLNSCSNSASCRLLELTARFIPLEVDHVPSGPLERVHADWVRT